MILKEGVSISGLQLEMKPVLEVVSMVYRANNQEMVITSGTEGKHSDASYHYFGLALDFRVRFFSEAVQKAVASEIISKLSTRGFYTVILHKDHHMHIQCNKDI